MASSPSLGPPQRAGASKTQASLARIIGVISTVPPPSDLEQPRARGDERGTRLDLRLRLGLPTEIGGGSAAGEGVGPTARGIAGGDRASGEETAAEESISAAESVAGEAPASKSSESECDPSGSGGRSPPKEALRGHGKECSEITNVRGGEEEEAKEISENGGGGGGGAGGSNGYLDLLLEAVREVLGGFLEEEHEGAAGAEEEEENMEAAAADQSRRRRCRRRRRRRESSNLNTEAEAAAAAAGGGGGGGGSKRIREASWRWGGPLDVYEETAPIVRSKRGRSQTLPSRYRDSVLEPWSRAGRH